MVPYVILAWIATLLSADNTSGALLVLLLTALAGLLTKQLLSKPVDEHIAQGNTIQEHLPAMPSHSKPIVPIYQPAVSAMRQITNGSELYVSHYLRKLNKSNYVVLDNLLLPSSGSKFKTTQIDHVVVSSYGVFIIETKGHTGYIVGSKQSKQWTQCKYNRNHTSLPNPVRQNIAHKIALSTILSGWVAAPVYTLCVFTSASKIIADDCENVFGVESALDYIRSFTVEVYSYAQVNRIVELLMQANLTDADSLNTHIAELKLQFTN